MATEKQTKKAKRRHKDNEIKYWRSKEPKYKSTITNVVSRSQLFGSPKENDKKISNTFPFLSQINKFSIHMGNLIYQCLYLRGWCQCPFVCLIYKR